MSRPPDDKQKPPRDPKRPPLEQDAPHLDKAKRAPDKTLAPKDKEPDTDGVEDQAEADERAVDETVNQSFPASDPPSSTGTHIGGPRPKVGRK